MDSRHRLEFLVYTAALFVLVVTDCFLTIDEVEAQDTLLLLGALFYFLSSITVLRGKWQYFGLIAALMVWTGSFSTVVSFLSITDHEATTYNRAFNIIYAFFGVFGGIRIYRAWLRYTRSQEEQTPVNDQGEAQDK